MKLEKCNTWSLNIGDRFLLWKTETDKDARTVVENRTVGIFAYKKGRKRDLWEMERSNEGYVFKIIKG